VSTRRTRCPPPRPARLMRTDRSFLPRRRRKPRWPSMTVTVTVRYDIGVLQVPPLLLLIFSSSSLSRRCPPSSFVAAQRAVRRQGRRIERRLRRCALPCCRSFQPCRSHGHLAFFPNRFLWINVQKVPHMSRCNHYAAEISTLISGLYFIG
jgi:hypothetical protein